MWIAHLSLQLRLALVESIESKTRSRKHRLAQTAFLRSSINIESLIADDATMTRILGEAIREAEK